MNYTYLLIDFILLVISMVITFKKTPGLAGNWKFTVPASLASGLLLAISSSVLARLGFLTFNSQYLLGNFIVGLPAEEWLFCFLMPFMTLNIYMYLNFRFPHNGLDKFSLTLSNLLLGIFVAVLFFFYRSGNIYLISIYGTLLLLLGYIEYVNKLRFMYRFYRAYLFCMVLFYPAYWLLTGLPQVYAYFMAIMLLAVYLFELFKNKARA